MKFKKENLSGKECEQNNSWLDNFMLALDKINGRLT